MLKVKDEVVVKLTSELDNVEVNGKRPDIDVMKQEAALVGDTKCLFASHEEIAPKTAEFSDKLMDEVEGYRLQNKFLNNEILELAHQREVDQEKINFWHERSLHQQALRYQLQSKYLILLSELNKPEDETSLYTDIEEPLLSKDDRNWKPGIVRRLVWEATQENGDSEQENDVSLRFSHYDKFGFTQVVEDGDESSLLNAASRLQRAASNISRLLDHCNTSVEAKWKRYQSEKSWLRNAEFKSLVRLGIPHELRHKVWKHLVLFRTLEIRDRLNSDGNYYQRLTDAAVAPLHSRQIDLDLLRTLPNNKFFAKIDSPGIQRLKRILGAYSLHNPEIGYCQGLNRIVAVALLYLCEEDAFWCLVAIVECIMPQQYYTSTLAGSQADQRVFHDILAEKLPRIHRHLEEVGIDISLITFNWFLCVFCDGVPPETMLSIWDVLLNESSKVLFRYALAFFKNIEDSILELEDYMLLFNLLRKMVYQMFDARTLSRIAFQDMNPLPMRKVQRLRVFHAEKVREELRKLDLVRSKFVSRQELASASCDMESDDGDNT